jgi:hypothetical protein
MCPSDFISLCCAQARLLDQCELASSAAPLCPSSAQCHDRVDYVILILFQCFDCFLSRHISLSHHQLNVLALQLAIIDFLVVIIILFRLLGLFFALAVIVIVPSMVMTSMITGIGILGSCELLGSIGLSLRVQVFDLRFTKDAELMLD